MLRLSNTNQLPSLIFIFFLASHFLMLMPVIHYFCLCPETGSQRECTCNCDKCSARKARAGRPRNLHSKRQPAKNPNYTSTLDPTGIAIINNSRFLDTPDISVEIMSCTCSGETKKIVSDLKPFIPMLLFLVLISPMIFKLVSRDLFLHLEIFLPPQKRPG